MYEIYTVLFAVDGLRELTLLSIVYDDLIVFAARYDVIARRRKVKTVDFVGVLAEHLGHFEAAHYVVDEFHLDHVWIGRVPRATAKISLLTRT